jgi:hypothetical protein
MAGDVRYLFMCYSVIFASFFGEIPIQVLYPILHLILAKRQRRDPFSLLPPFIFAATEA